MASARFSSLLSVLVLLTPLALGEEPAKLELTPELKKLIRQLDADDFADRMSASEQLAKLGKDALPALEEGVRSDSPEASIRSFELLQQMFEKGNGAAKAAAKASLEELAKGDDRVATQAKTLLEPKPPAVDPNQSLPLGGIRILGGGVRIVRGRVGRVVPVAPVVEEAAVARKAISISTSIGPDGVKTINVDEEGKKFKVVEDPKKGIEGEYTGTKDGKETTHRFAAKDGDELKTKHPEAFKLYERFVKGAGAVRVDFPAGIVAATAPAPREHVQELLDNIEKQIAKSTKEIEAAKANKDPRVEVLATVLESYTRLRARYQEQLKQLKAKEEEEKKK